MFVQGQEPGQDQGHGASQPPLQDPLPPQPGSEASQGVPGLPAAPLFSDADNDAGLSLNGNGVSSSAGRHPGAVGDPPAAAGILPFSPNFDPDWPDPDSVLILGFTQSPFPGLADYSVPPPGFLPPELPLLGVQLQPRPNSRYC